MNLLHWACTILLFPSIAAADDGRDVILLPGGPVTLASAPSSAPSGDGVLIVIQLKGEPGAEEIRSLEAAGCELRQYLGGGAYWAVVRPPGNLKAVEIIRGAYLPRPEDKVAPELSRLLATRADYESVRLRAAFIEGVGAEEAKTAVRNAGARALSGLMTGDYIELVVRARDALNLAASNKVVALVSAERPRRPLNRRSEKLSGADTASAEFGLFGTGITVGMWDGGSVFKHAEFGDRLIIAERGRVDIHATHVAGTIGAAGLNLKARGFAPEAVLVSYNFFGDVANEIRSARRSYGILLANNSWGLATGWEWEGGWVWYGDKFFGQYSLDARAMDQVVRRDGVVIVFAAGNDREDKGAGNGRFFDAESGRSLINVFHKQDGPFDSIGEIAAAKNVIAVGAVKDNGAMTHYSSWGPTDDGRVKPEICANGEGLLSTAPQNRYARLSGTSMAAPSVVGGLTLAAEYWRRIYSGRLPPAMARALLAVTAIDMGEPGPDYSFGFGVMDVEAMTRALEAGAGNGTVLQDAVSAETRSKSYALTVPAGTQQLRIAIAWIDPPAAALAARTLVNDLDLSLSAPGGAVHLPWILDPARPGAPAKRGRNAVDTIELVEVVRPKPGDWGITVTAAALHSGKVQSFALVVYGDTALKIR